MLAGEVAGFVHVWFGGQNAAWLESLFVSEEHRGQGVGGQALATLDRLMEERRTTAMFVDVAPRNEDGPRFYRQAGSDHLNLIQLRKNYDPRLNKTEDVDLLGIRLKKY